ncbi:Uncharacterised protein [Bordetella pertussis]|nr:Uncharacterised protein [Bordetella pertussis]
MAAAKSAPSPASRTPSVRAVRGRACRPRAGCSCACSPRTATTCARRCAKVPTTTAWRAS